MSIQETKERKPTPLNSCRGCPEVWAAAGAAHCSGCHQTFSSVTLFDHHRSAVGEYGTCLDPLGLHDKAGYRTHLFRDGMWRSPEMTEDEKTRVFGGRR